MEGIFDRKGCQVFVAPNRLGHFSVEQLLVHRGGWALRKSRPITPDRTATRGLA
jgi:hypothetical protein